jgi:hypothetical protein
MPGPVQVIRLTNMWVFDLILDAMVALTVLQYRRFDTQHFLQRAKVHRLVPQSSGDSWPASAVALKQDL